MMESDSAARTSAKSGYEAVVARVDGEERRKIRRTEYAVPTANSKGKNPQEDPAQALSEESSKTGTEELFSGEESSSKSAANNDGCTNRICGPNSQQQGQESTSGHCSSSV